MLLGYYLEYNLHSFIKLYRIALLVSFLLFANLNEADVFTVVLCQIMSVPVLGLSNTHLVLKHFKFYQLNFSFVFFCKLLTFCIV